MRHVSAMGLSPKSLKIQFVALHLRDVFRDIPNIPPAKWLIRCPPCLADCSY
jgi:hypothetical protein